MKVLNVHASWFSKGFCHHCGHPIVISKVQGTEDEFWWYCASKSCLNHDQPTKYKEGQQPPWVVFRTEITSDLPRYKHNDPESIFLGVHEGRDLYFSNSKNIVPAFQELTARYGDGEFEYHSAPWHLLAETDLPLLEARRRAIQAGILAQGMPLKEKEKHNMWDTNLREVFQFILEATKERFEGWQWIKNSDCKYIELRIDMRDGGFLLKNRDSKRIDLKTLQFQYGDRPWEK